MTTTTHEVFTVKFDASPDAREAGLQWDVVSEGGDVMDSFETRAEAHRDAKERTAEAEKVALEEAVQDALNDDLDLATLRKLADLLGVR